MVDRGHGFDFSSYEILLLLQSETMALLEVNARTEHRATQLPRALVEFYEDFCINGGTIFLSMMHGDTPDLVIRLGQSISHCKGSA
jgi:hypothetical protein